MSYGILYAVVINFDSSVVFVSGRPRKKRVRIFDGFTHAAFRKHSKISILQPLFKFKYQRIGLHGYVFPSDMCPTADQSNFFHPFGLFVSCIAATLYNATVASQQFINPCARTVATVIMKHDVPCDAIAYAPLIPVFRMKQN